MTVGQFIKKNHDFNKSMGISFSDNCLLIRSLLKSALGYSELEANKIMKAYLGKCK